jgi:hypothetical protein
LTLSNLSQSTYRKLIQTLKECIISEQKASGRQTSPNLMLTTYKIWRQSFISTRTNWCGSGWMIIIPKDSFISTGKILQDGTL